MIATDANRRTTLSQQVVVHCWNLELCHARDHEIFYRFATPKEFQNFVGSHILLWLASDLVLSQATTQQHPTNADGTGRPTGRNLIQFSATPIHASLTCFIEFDF